MGEALIPHTSACLSPEGYFPPLGHLLKELITFEGQMCEAAHLNAVPNTSLPRSAVFQNKN